MSSYMEFFIKDENRLIFIGAFPHFYPVYQAFGPAPYGKLARLDTVHISKVTEKLREEIQQLNEDRADLVKEEKNIWATSNPLSEKRETAAQVRDSIAEIDQLITDKKFAFDFACTLNIMNEHLEVYEGSSEAVRAARLYYGIDVELENSKEEKI